MVSSHDFNPNVPHEEKLPNPFKAKTDKKSQKGEKEEELSGSTMRAHKINENEPLMESMKSSNKKIIAKFPNLAKVLTKTNDTKVIFYTLVEALHKQAASLGVDHFIDTPKGAGIEYIIEEEIKNVDIMILKSDLKDLDNDMKELKGRPITEEMKNKALKLAKDIQKNEFDLQHDNVLWGTIVHIGNHLTGADKKIYSTIINRHDAINSMR